MTTIYSDDPNAIALLQSKLTGLEANQERMKKVNAIIRKSLIAEDKISQLKELGIGEQEAYTLVNGDRMNNKGYPGWKLQGNNAEIRRVKLRITELQEKEKQAQSPDLEREKEYPELGLTLVRNYELDRIQLKFDENPGDEICAYLGQRGFKWSPTNTAWQRHLNGNGEFAAETVIRYLSGEFK